MTAPTTDVDADGVPGEWTCDKCGYGESRRILSAIDGSVGVQPMAVDPRCPNDGERLRALTWRELARSQSEGVRALSATISSQSTELERLRDQLGSLEHAFDQRYDRAQVMDIMLLARSHAEHSCAWILHEYDRAAQSSDDGQGKAGRS